MTLNPQSTCYTVGLHVRQQHSLCPCYMHVLVRCWHVGTTPVHQALAGATGHRLIERWVGRTERWLYRWYYQRIKRRSQFRCQRGLLRVRFVSCAYVPSSNEADTYHARPSNASFKAVVSALLTNAPRPSVEKPNNHAVRSICSYDEPAPRSSKLQYSRW